MSDFYDTIARYYDAENIEMTEDLPFLSEIAAIYGDPILDVGCGTGRVMLHLAQEGYQCVGVDSSPDMVERGRRKLSTLGDNARNVRFMVGDISDHVAEQPYSLILLAYHLFMHFGSQEQQINVLQQLTSILAEDGVIVFDLPNAGEAFGTQDDDAIRLDRTFIEPETGHVVMQQSLSHIDRISQALHITWIYDEITSDGLMKRTLAPLTLRYVFFNELKLLLRLVGLSIVDIYGDYDFSPFEDGAPRMLVVAGKTPHS